MAAPNTYWQILTKVVEKMQNDTFFLRQALIGNDSFNSLTDKVMVRNVVTGKTAASIGLRGDPANAVNIGVTLDDVEKTPPQIFETDYVAEQHILQNFDPNTLDVLSAQSDIVRSFGYYYGRKLTGMRLRYDRAVEKMIGQIASSGKIAVDDDKRSFEIDFNTKKLNYTLNTSADPLSDIGEMCQKYGDENGVFPNVIMTTQAIANKILAHAKVEKWINKNTFSFGQLASRFQNPSIRFMGSFSEFAIPDIYVYTGDYKDASGTAHKYIDDGKLIITNTDYWSLGHAAMVDYDVAGQTSVVPNESNNGLFVGDFLVKEKISDDGTKKMLYFRSYPLPMVDHGDYVHTATVTVE